MTTLPKSAWHLAFVPLMFFLAFCAGWVLAQPILALRGIGMPEDAFFRGGTNGGIIALLAGLFPPSIGLGLMGTNLFIWIIPPLRRFFEADAKRSRTASYTKAMRELGVATAVLFLLCYPVALAGGMVYFSAAPSGFVYRGWFEAGPKLYAWPQVKTVETQCYRGGRGFYPHFWLVLKDDTQIDVAAASLTDFIAAYPELSKNLKGALFRKLPPPDAVIAPGPCPGAWKRYFDQPPKG